jgi:hypothetical protein
MKYLAFVAVGAVGVVLTACSQAVTPSAAPAAAPTRSVSVTYSPGSVNCRQRYVAWKRGPARAVVAALSTIDSANTAKDAPALTAALKRVRPAIVKSASHPIPSCADPKGYWTALLMHVNEAASSAGSASAMLAAMKDVPEIERKLRGELKHLSSGLFG